MVLNCINYLTRLLGDIAEGLGTIGHPATTVPCAAVAKLRIDHVNM